MRWCSGAPQSEVAPRLWLHACKVGTIFRFASSGSQLNRHWLFSGDHSLHVFLTSQSLEWEEFLFSSGMSFLSFIPLSSSPFASLTPQSLHWFSAAARPLAIYLQASSAPRWPNINITSSFTQWMEGTLVWSLNCHVFSSMLITCCWEERVSESACVANECKVQFVGDEIYSAPSKCYLIVLSTQQWGLLFATYNKKRSMSCFFCSK